MKRNKTVVTLSVLGGLTAALVGGTLVAPQSAQADVRYERVRRENNPEIDRAIRNLQDARVATQRANRDFGGHRANAARLIDQAIAELRAAKRFDNRN